MEYAFCIVIVARTITDRDIMNDCKTLSECGVWMDTAKLRDVTALYNDITKFSAGSLTTHLAAPMTVVALGEDKEDDKRQH